MKKTGFTLVEVIFVATMVTSLSVGVYQAVARGKRTQCLNNLRQIYQAISMFSIDYGYLPKAKFFPSSPSDPKGIQNILKSYGTRPEIFYCPSIPSQLNKYGTNYIWNDNLSGTTESSSEKWLMTEMTAVSKKVPPPHPPYFCILYADGHAKAGPRVNFPDVDNQIEKKKQPSPSFTSPTTFKPSIILIPEKEIAAGEKTKIKFFITDTSGNKVNLKGKTIEVKTDDKKDIFPEDISINKDTYETSFEIILKKAGKRNITLTEAGTKLQGATSVNVSPGKAESFLFKNIPPSVKAGSPVKITVLSSDKFGNPSNFNGNAILADLSEGIEKKIEIKNGKWEGEIIFKKASEFDILVAGNDKFAGKSNSFQVLPSDKLKISVGVDKKIVAGEKFDVTIKITDEFNNIIKNFTGKFKVLLDKNDGEFPEEVVFTGDEEGTKNIEFVLFKSGEREIKIYSDKLKTTKKIFVSPAPLNHFEIEEIGTQTAGVPFTVFVKGKDKWNNRIQSFYISDKTGSIKRVETDFSAGMWIEKVMIEKAGKTEITIDDGNGHYGKSNIFLVKPDKIDKVDFENLPLVVEKDKEYKIKISLLDKYDNPVKENVDNFEFSSSKKCISEITGKVFPADTTLKFLQKGICEIYLIRKDDNKILGKHIVFVLSTGGQK